ncbi:hypothetical protein FBUS_07085 [Fasciolopsis buskii]|uniref:Uncharacterized protein n=1 Tax=Fasciolopsis buskii TaxID=27845 RepID=A0A8E0S6H6_9TREM|nr:hypothetical protein FBUS_07085 [Fasciolopsis buski]
MDDFLAELWGASKEVDLDADASALDSQSPQKQRTIKSPHKRRLKTISELSKNFSDHFDDLQLSPRLPFSEPNGTGSYMLPRYLADDVKRGRFSQSSTRWAYLQVFFGVFQSFSVAPIPAHLNLKLRSKNIVFYC